MNIQQYLNEIEKRTHEIHKIADEARKKGFDPADNVEVPIARTLAERVVGLISAKYPQIVDNRIVERIIELENIHGQLEPVVAVNIAEEIAKQKFCKFASLLEAIDAGLRVAFGYLTVGVVAAPLEGYTHFELKKTREGKDYFALYFSGPIGAAGRTIASTFVLIADYLRQIFGYAEYDPTEEEIKRAITEVYDRHERVTNLQYLPTEKEIDFLYRRLPVQITGDPTEEIEVSNYKNLNRIETNRIRSGFCLVLGEGISQKAPKLIPILSKLKEKGFDLSRWDFLSEFVALQKKLHEEKKELESSATYIKDLVAGRPVLGHPSCPGGFRLRYGKCRTNGLSSMAMSPLSMELLNNYIGIGTQLRYEGPGKSSAMSICDDIEGPIIKLINGDVVKIDTWEKAKRYKEEVKEILFLGDFLVNYGEYFNRGKSLQKPGYCEEWYVLELEKASKDKEIGELKTVVDKLVSNWRTKISAEEAIKISELTGVALHPSHIFYWTQIDNEEFHSLIDWLAHGKIEGKFILPYGKIDSERFQKGKRALELIGAEHKISIENVIIEEEITKALLANLGVRDFETLPEEFKSDKNTLEIINKTSKFKIKDKAGTWIGARMGRPEKAKLRKLDGSPNILFPVGKEGGRLRSVQAACEVGTVRNSFPIFYCENCKTRSIYRTCENCGNRTQNLFYCRECDKISDKACKEHNGNQKFAEQELDIKHYLEKAKERLKLDNSEMPALIKGVRGTSSSGHVPENLAKGILRTVHNLQVNKDGTIRYDLTEMPLTHFKPKEIGTSIEKLKELGYEKDVKGAALTDENQLIEILPQDIILPACAESEDEKADEVFLQIANFIDSLLVRLYNMKPFYNASSKNDLIGHLVLGLAPHTSAGIVGRIIGFSKTQACLAQPMWHAAQRRDCEGDETCIIMLMDVFLNFSKQFLPSHRGATQDAPLVVTSILIPAEIDDMAFDMDVLWKYPLELYEAAEKEKYPREIKIEQLKSRLKSEKAYYDFGFTHTVEDINHAVRCSAYKLIPTMREKVEGQMILAERLRSVDTSDTAKLIIDRHFIRDLKGNLRKFSMQGFRCVKCNEIMRRPPLTGVCPKCDGKIIFTINEGGIKKYLEPALGLAEKYNLSNYIKQNLQIVKENIDSIFGKELEKQEALGKWF